MKNIPLLVGTIIGTLILVVVIAVVFSQSSQPKVVGADLLTKNARFFKGPSSPQVTIVEFSDFQCPACKGSEPLVQQVVAKYTNEVQLVYRQYPLFQIHKNAQQAAQVAEAAATYNKFWEMHDMLFEHQEEWAELDQASFMAKVDGYLDKLQIDKNEFKKKIESQEVRDKIAVDVSDANKIGVDGTPTFFVNGQQTSAPQLLSTVESLLKK
jgi:protein-disulfide isomerase